jgi:hypothetical protein
VQAQGWNRNRSTGLIVAGIIDVLEVKGSEKAAPEMGGVNPSKIFSLP